MKLALTPIVAQLRHGGFRQVTGLLEYSEQAVPPRGLPALFVVPVGERAGSNTVDIGRDQAVDVEVSVMLVIDGTKRNADGIAEDLTIEGERVKAALVGWTHPEASRPFAFTRASLSSIGSGVVAWDMRFATRYRLRW